MVIEHLSQFEGVGAALAPCLIPSLSTGDRGNHYLG